MSLPFYTKVIAPMNPYQELLSCQQDFVYFAKNYLKILHPIQGSIPFELHQYQKDLLDIYEKNRYVLVIKFRQGGFTTLTILYLLWKCMFQQDQRVFITSKTERESAHIGNIVTRAIDLFPDWFVPRMSKNTKQEKVFSTTGSLMNFGIIENIKVVNPTDLVIDEASFIPDMEDKWIATWPHIAKANVRILSTVGDITEDGLWFFDMCEKAKEKRNAFFLYKGNYTEHPDYNNQLWVEETKRQLGEAGFLQEVMCCWTFNQVLPVIKYENLETGELVSRAVRLMNDGGGLGIEDQTLIYEMAMRLTKLTIGGK